MLAFWKTQSHHCKFISAFIAFHFLARTVVKLPLRSYKLAGYASRHGVCVWRGTCLDSVNHILFRLASYSGQPLDDRAGLTSASTHFLIHGNFIIKKEFRKKKH